MSSIAPLAAGCRLIVEARAGKMTLEDKMLKADPRKGLLRVIRVRARAVLQRLPRRETHAFCSPPALNNTNLTQQTEDGLLHLEWFERLERGMASEAPENDTIVFPGEAEFDKARCVGGGGGGGGSEHSQSTWPASLTLVASPPTRNNT